MKEQVHDFWNDASCGEVYSAGTADVLEGLDQQARTRYAIEPCILTFARFAEGAGKDVLEIGVGMGADHLEWAKSGPRSLRGVDLTQRAVEHTRNRLRLHGFQPEVRVADAEALPFPDASFDLVYSYGVLHHTPDTAAALREVWRVLRPGGRARVMIYNKRSLVGLMLWLRYGLLAGAPGRSLEKIYADHLESPGTQAFSRREAAAMLTEFAAVDIQTALGPGDLLLGAVGQRHRGLLLSFARTWWPRWFIRRWLGRWGLGLLVEATK